MGKVSRTELERLLIELLPKAYFDLAKSAEPQSRETLKRFEQCYRMGFEAAPVDLRRTVTRRFLFILENESEYVVQSYEGCFFRCADLEYLDEQERALVKMHFFASLSKQASIPLVTAAAGVGAFLETEEEARAFFVPLVLNLLEEKDEALSAAIVRRASEEHKRLSAENQRSVASWLVRLKRSVEREGRHPVRAIERLETALAG
jgi:hypothetical protein